MHPTADDILNDVLEGLSRSPRAIPPKYFYNERGSQLFEAITNTEEYYPTRTECSILIKNKQEISQYLPKDCLLIEPGCGNCSKVRIFIEDLQPSAYVPMDISRDHLQDSANQIAKEFSWLSIHAVCNDFSLNIELPRNLPDKPRVVFFPGSSIGNFHPQEAVKYISKIAELVGDEGNLLIGVDMKKNKSILESAYNDKEGITADFNLNLLNRFNQELSADFDLSNWVHKAFYNETYGRIEMHLKSIYKQVVKIQDHEFYFAEDECIHTECSYKYSVEEFQELADKAGFNLKKVWLDDQSLFAVYLFIKK